MKKIAAGTVAGYGVVSESDRFADLFGNFPPDGNAIIWESPLLAESCARARADMLKSYGRRLIVKLVVVEEVE